jgi:hypothetical protein
MEITYQLCVGDLAEQVIHLRSISSAAKRSRRGGYTVLFVFWTITGLCLWFRTRDTFLVVGWGLSGLAALAMFLATSERGQRSLVMNLYRDGRNPGLFAPTTLRIEPEGLVHEAARAVGKLRWEYLERVCRTDRYLFVYVDTLSAITVPKDGVLSGDFDSFARKVEEHWRAAKPLPEGIDEDTLPVGSRAATYAASISRPIEPKIGPV